MNIERGYYNWPEEYYFHSGKYKTKVIIYTTATPVYRCNFCLSVLLGMYLSAEQFSILQCGVFAT